MTDSVTLKESVKIMKSTDKSECEDITSGDDIANKNQFMALNPAEQRCRIKSLIDERNHMCYKAALFVLCYSIALYAYPNKADMEYFALRVFPGRVDISRIVWIVIDLSGMVFLVSQCMAALLCTILCARLTLRIKRLRTLANEKISDVSNVQK